MLLLVKLEQQVAAGGNVDVQGGIGGITHEHVNLVASGCYLDR